MIRLYLSILFILLYSVGYNQTEGVLQTTEYSTNFNNKYVELRKNKIWFKDSSVIYEFRLEMNSYGSIAEGTIIKSAYPLAAYFYLDLKTMMCQLYYNLKDTAKPVYKFAVKDGDGMPFWRFFRSKIIPQVNKEEIVALPDTTIDNILYKRIKIQNKNPKENSYNVYYLKCDAQKNIVHMNWTLEQLFPACKVFRSDFVYGGKNIMPRVFEYKIISNDLTENEKRIFQKWGQNAKNIKLPIISFNEAFSGGFSHNVKFDEEPIITILPHDSTFLKLQPITKINTNDVKLWLQKNISSSTPYKNRIIQKVLHLAHFDKMYAEILHEHEKENLIIVPLKNEYFSQYFTLKNPPLQYLIFVENAKGEIRRGDIVLFYSNNSKVTALPNNSFYNLFNSEFNSVDGTYALITLGDVKQWEMDFENHQKTEFRVWRGEQKPTEDSTNCRTWYLDITRHLNWNNQEDRKYLGNTCTGCPPNQLCDKE